MSGQRHDRSSRQSLVCGASRNSALRKCRKRLCLFKSSQGFKNKHISQRRNVIAYITQETVSAANVFPYLSAQFAGARLRATDTARRISFSGEIQYPHKFRRKITGNKKPSPAFAGDGFFCTRRVLEAPAGFEPAIKVLQTYALPLGYSADLERITRLELATSTLARWRSTR